MAARTGGGEWPGTLDLAALRASGWRPTPFRQFILKIHSRCNLACDYCYVYEMADQGWREQPRRMGGAVVDATARRIGEHVRAHGLTDIEVILHGGEPLLAGPDLIRRAVVTVRREVGARARVRVGVQTNGVLLDEPFLSLFDELDVQVSVSLDGDERGHDRHRLHADGRGSHAQTAAGLARLTAEPYRHLFGGLLATIDLANPPVETYEALLRFQPPAIDFLLPHGNWDTPPPGLDPGSPDAPYGDWLTAVFDRWTAAPRRETHVRLFRDLIALSLGRPSTSEQVGLSPAAMVVIETDGTVEQVDTLKSAYEGAAATGLHVGRDGFDAALALPATAARQIGADALSDTCRACAVGHICGGGQYVHRYRAGSGFRNPSVYCRDLFRLAAHVRDAVGRDLARARDEAARRVQPRSEPMPPELKRLSIPEKVFAGLAQGGGGAYAVDELWRVQRSKRLLLLRWVREAARSRDPAREARARQAYALLADIQGRDPDAVRAVLDHPAVGVWAHAVAARGADTDPITALAAAAAIRARDPRPIEVVGGPDGLFLPSLGMAVPFAGTGIVRAAPGAPVTISSDADTFVLPDGDPHRDAPGWHGLRTLEAEYHGMALHLLLDDRDPLRSVGGDPMPRLTHEETEQWRSVLRSAWRLLVRRHWTVAEEAARTLRVLTPLAPPAQGTRSSTVHEAFGAMYASLPPDERDLAVTFAHEVQHAKLGALNDAIPLTRPDDGRRFYAAWRDDPRPAAGLLTGAYAHLGVAGFWRRQRHHEHGPSALRAHTEFAHWRDASALATGTLLRSGALTEDGERFVTEMDRTLRSWRREPVPPAALDQARTTANEHRRRWRAEHGDPNAREQGGSTTAT
ncbi:FxsB family cyclophane-forming radical SAM/SPASM peptide maturase [Actinomadura harenae]|uniref:FxsB family cyclophane-forming radical SAM/SPASM peptide maturase n=1 Tax=Actinomadura harenae TaxID=2483351 RepID=UPI002D799C65|nr:FxsB family cyclophane-forming radical SAM/SPASM peptide maturase [Actinomadura harenae]